ncbi:hypothetical protein C1924_13800 [Stenotrophomonas sp. ESTM1D_MKCIP4_1]|uniref:DUF418 domain-containing protein n=1 Tax=Stenotrophomonas sp. ESTM1D_MKCIP4_1 TaxID=2072414 RepID=UPI000D53DD6E|nr:DUF418 domain-containing protein [Stenotrophomonas sp. ESTM1D_MKCIP4_1]AWH54179.1 hypothetical protein C1924_13800 [Stenotrophomonas sp. ESTM1D_MKCIP4_1]
MTDLPAGCPVNTASPSLQPVASGERIAVLDVLRGVALLGILLMNIEALSGPLDLAFTGIDARWHGLDYAADAFVYIFVQGKFFTLFSLLFGAGFAVMAQRAQAAGREFAPFYLRRSLGLALIGLCHALLVWSGDILVLYALVSLPLLACREAPRSWLPWMGGFVYLAGVSMMLLIGALVTLSPAQDLQKMLLDAQQAIDQQRLVYGQGSWMQGNVQRLHEFGSSLGALVITGPEVLGMFLIGSWFAASGALTAPERFPRLYAGLRWVALPMGLLVTLGGVLWKPYLAPGEYTLESTAAMSLVSVGAVPMCLGYLAWVVHWRARLGWLAPSGRMALTHYLAQSLVCTWLFNHYGLGWFDLMPRAWQLLFALLLFALQVVFSHLWLKRFRFGPLEWLWRAMTYRQWPPMRRERGQG